MSFTYQNQIFQYYRGLKCDHVPDCADESDEHDCGEHWTIEPLAIRNLTFDRENGKFSFKVASNVDRVNLYLFITAMNDNNSGTNQNIHEKVYHAFD